MPERFISKAIKPITETADTSRMALGEPGLPYKFVWRDRTVTVQAILRTWRETGKCCHGSPEMLCSQALVRGGHGLRWDNEAIFRKAG